MIILAKLERFYVKATKNTQKLIINVGKALRFSPKDFNFMLVNVDV